MLQVSIFDWFSSLFSSRFSVLEGWVHFGLRNMVLRPLPPALEGLAPLLSLPSAMAALLEI